MPSLRCLISALTQAGGGDLLFRFASSIQSCCGDGGALQAESAVCGEHSPCSGHTGFAPLTVFVLSPSTLLRLRAALYGAGPALSAVPVFGSSTKARVWLRLHFVPSPASAVQAARGLGALCQGAARLFPSQRATWAARGPGTLSPDAARLFPPRPQRAPPVGSQEVFRQEPGPVCRVGGGGFSEAEFSPFPSPLPPSSSRDGAALLWSFSVPLFCEPLAVCSGCLIFPRSPTV